MIGVIGINLIKFLKIETNKPLKGGFLLPVIRMNRAQRADAHLNIGSDDL